MTIEFIYRDTHVVEYVDGGTGTPCTAEVRVTTTAVGAEALTEAFKAFLRLAGYHPETVDSVRWHNEDRQSLPMQLDWIDEHEEGGI